MQFLTLLLAVASVALVDASPAPAPVGPAPAKKSPASNQKPGNIPPNWCNSGTGGDETCERNKLHTFCCYYKPHGEYKHQRDVKFPSASNRLNQYGHPILTCGEDEMGLVYCA
ncbi:hypothetical protein E4U53_008065 [Claviceps sorghi]|nr:hypothetical protein E4U53_008065 [Claviceps sorghi]